MSFLKSTLYKLRLYENRREFPRREVSTAIKYRIKDKEQKFSIAFCKNISANGILFEVGRTLGGNPCLEFMFPLAQTVDKHFVDSFYVEGRVVSYKRDEDDFNKIRYAIQFRKLSYLTKRYLVNYMSQFI